MTAHLDDDVRRSDPDRWLSSRFIGDADARADLIALYAFNHEIARAPSASSQPLVAQMRLAFWREALDEMFEGRTVRAHPAAQALALAVRRRALPREELEGLIDARHRDLDGGPLKPEEVEPYLDATSGRLTALAARLLDPSADPQDVKAAARAFGLAGLARLGGRLPPDWSAADIAGRVNAALVEARPAVRRLPPAAFPAVAHAALARVYAGGRALSDFSRRARLTWAVATGRI